MTPPTGDRMSSDTTRCWCGSALNPDGACLWAQADQARGHRIATDVDLIPPSPWGHGVEHDDRPRLPSLLVALLIVGLLLTVALLGWRLL